MYIKKQPIGELRLKLGESYFAPNEEATQIDQYIVIEAKKNYNYWSKKLLNALNTGVINQSVYNAIIKNENETRQVFLIAEDIALEKEALLSFIEIHSIQEVETEGTTVQVLSSLNSNNYQIIKKI